MTMLSLNHCAPPSLFEHLCQDIGRMAIPNAHAQGFRAVQALLINRDLCDDELFGDSL